MLLKQKDVKKVPLQGINANIVNKTLEYAMGKLETYAGSEFFIPDRVEGTNIDPEYVISIVRTFEWFDTKSFGKKGDKTVP